MKKLFAASLLACSLGLCGNVFAEDDFYIPLDVDFSSAEDFQDAGNVSSSVKQGLWIETTASVKSLIRDIATGEKSGYEFDSLNFLSNANWWFWGDISPKYHIDAEISVWNFDMPLYKCNTYADGLPAVTFVDGLQSLCSMPFSFLYNGASSKALNKLGFTLKTPYVNGKFGIGGLGKNGMSGYTGIYNVIDPWLDVGKGFTEISNGDDWRNAGDITFDVVAALSMMRGTFGTYGFFDVSYLDVLKCALTWGSYTEANELFRYSDNNKNSVSAYVSFSPISSLKIEAHGLCSFGTDIQFGIDSMAFAGRMTFENLNFYASLMESYAGSSVDSVWGADGDAYDLINADTYTTVLDLSVTPVNGFVVGLDEIATLNDVSDVVDSAWNFRAEPFVELEFSSLAGFDLGVGAYGVVNIDKLPAGFNKPVYAYFEEAGLELSSTEVPFANNVLFAYAAKLPWSDDAVSYKVNSILYQSLILNVDFTKDINAHFGSVIRTPFEAYADARKVVPFAFAIGASFANLELPGKPMLWMHFSYGMDPYSENNYSLYRKDNLLNRNVHKSYLLNDLSGSMNVSEIALGLIWNL